MFMVLWLEKKYETPEVFALIMHRYQLLRQSIN